MEYRLLLAVLTVALACLAWLTWFRTRCLGFVIGAAVLYYWTLFGAWELIGDLSHGGSEHHYHYLFGKMFSVQLDGDYFAALVWYGVFLIVALGSALVITGRRPVDHRDFVPIRLSHSRLLMAAAVCLLGSVLIVRRFLFEAAAFGTSGYSVTSAGSALTPLFVVHQSLNLMAVIPLAIGVPLLASGRQSRYLWAQDSKALRWGYLVIVGALFLFGMVMGNKSEIFFGLISAVVFHLLNARTPGWRRLLVLGVLAFAGVALIDYIRSLALAELVSRLDPGRAFSALTGILTSNEAFAAHFSLYGVMHHHVPWTWGTSVLSLALSAVPRVFWAGRPDTIYAHYAASLGLEPGQGYTIHHATGWYLNFGPLGVLLGGGVLGSLWGWLYRKTQARGALPAGWRAACAALAFAFFTGGLPQLIREGLEGYKTVLMYQILAPALLVWFSRTRDVHA